MQIRGQHMHRNPIRVNWPTESISVVILVLQLRLLVLLLLSRDDVLTVDRVVQLRFDVGLQGPQSQNKCFALFLFADWLLGDWALVLIEIIVLGCGDLSS